MCVCFFSLGAVRFASYLFLSLSVSHCHQAAVSLITAKCDLLFLSDSRSQSSHYSLALVASMSLKIKLTHSASLLCNCNYKSALLLCEWESNEQVVKGKRKGEGGGGRREEGEQRLTRRVAARPPLGIKLAQATGESIQWQSAQWCTHPTVYVSGNGKHCCYTVWALHASACERPASHRDSHILCIRGKKKSSTAPLKSLSANNIKILLGLDQYVSLLFISQPCLLPR